MDCLWSQWCASHGRDVTRMGRPHLRQKQYVPVIPSGNSGRVVETAAQLNATQMRRNGAWPL
eukprot:4806413-Prorocentrum_lima.AAC.1